MRKTVEAPHVQFIGRVVDVSVNIQMRQVTKHVEITQTQYIDKVVDMPVTVQRQVPRPSINQVTKHAEIPKFLIHRRHTCGDAATAPSDSDCVEDSGNPAGAVRRQSCGGACEHADAPVPHVAAKNTLQEHISERTQIASAPAPQILEEPCASLEAERDE